MGTRKPVTAAAAAKSLQSCPTLCDPKDDSPPGSPVPGILQARTLEGVAISFSNAWKWEVEVKSLSRVKLLGTPWTAVYQAPPSMGFFRQEYWSGVPLPSLGNQSWLLWPFLTRYNDWKTTCFEMELYVKTVFLSTYFFYNVHYEWKSYLKVLEMLLKSQIFTKKRCCGIRLRSPNAIICSVLSRVWRELRFTIPWNK